MKPEAAPKGRMRPLHDALNELRASVSSPTVLARELGVAPSTLKKIYAGTFVELAGRAQKDIDPKQRRAWAESITKLAMKVSDRTRLQLDPEISLGEFGLTPKGDDVVAAAMARAKNLQLEATKQTDPVLKNIQARSQGAQDGKSGVVRTGILSWPPISEKYDEASFGRSFCRRLVGTLNPKHWDVEYLERETINDCLDRLFGGVDGDDVAFGVYSTVSRQLRGLDFVPVPGIGIPLHALYYLPEHLSKLRSGVGDPDERPINWEIIRRRATKQDVSILAFVLDDEVGELYLRGPCGYGAGNDDNIITLHTYDADEIAQELRDPPADQVTIFVADRPTCIRVALSMRKERSGDPNAFKGWSIEDSTYPGIAFNDSGFPVYRLGLAFRADSERWGSLLKSAIQEELFRNDRDWTAELYAKLIFRNFTKLALVPLEPTLAGPVAASFAKAVYTLLVEEDPKVGRRIDLLDANTGKRFHRELHENWNFEKTEHCDEDCNDADHKGTSKLKSTRR